MEVEVLKSLHNNITIINNNNIINIKTLYLTVSDTMPKWGFVGAREKKKREKHHKNSRV